MPNLPSPQTEFHLITLFLEERLTFVLRLNVLNILRISVSNVLKMFKMESRGLNLNLQCVTWVLLWTNSSTQTITLQLTCKTSQYHLRNIARIRKYLDEASTETLVHGFVGSKLDYCNAHIHGLPKYQLSWLQFNSTEHSSACCNMHKKI